MRPKPVDLPPPKWVRNLKTKMQLGSFTSYRLASLSFSSDYTHRTPQPLRSRTHAHDTQQYRAQDHKPRSHLGDVGAAGVDHLEHLQARAKRDSVTEGGKRIWGCGGCAYELLAGKEAVCHKLAGAKSDRRCGLGVRHG
jgi:hypothetical protein